MLRTIGEMVALRTTMANTAMYRISFNGTPQLLCDTSPLEMVTFEEYEILRHTPWQSCIMDARPDPTHRLPAKVPLRALPSLRLPSRSHYDITAWMHVHAKWMRNNTDSEYLTWMLPSDEHWKFLVVELLIFLEADQSQSIHAAFIAFIKSYYNIAIGWRDAALDLIRTTVKYHSLQASHVLIIYRSSHQYVSPPIPH